MHNGIMKDHYQLGLFSKIASAFSISLGIFSLLSWIFILWMPPSITNIFVLVRPNSAFCFILAGVSLWLHVEQRSNFSYNIALICAAIVLMLGALTLMEYFFGIDLGIDKLISAPSSIIPPLQLSNIPIGRMSPMSATDFVLIGCSLLFLDSKLLRPTVQQIFIAIVIIITFLQLLGYIYKLGNHEIVFGISESYTQMSLLTIIAFLILSFGILCVRSGSGIMSVFTSKYNGGIIARRLVPPAILLPIIVGYLVSLGGKWIGFQEAEFGLSLLVMTTVIIFSIIVAVNALIVDRADIARKEVEYELKLNQIKLKAVLDNTTTLIFIQNTQSKFLLINRQFEKLFHKGSEEILGQLPSQVLPAEFASKSMDRIQKVIRARSPVVIEENYPYDDEVHCYISNYFPLFNEHNVIYAVGCIATDVTDLNRINEQLKENQERLMLALKSADAGVWSWDIPKDKIIWDEHMYKLFGIKPGKFAGSFNAVLNLIHPEDRAYFNNQVTNSLELGNELRVEFRIVHPDGSIHYLADRGKLFYDQNGYPLRMMGVCWDMTEHKQAEIDLQFAKETAEKLAEKAEEASRVKGAFLAAMSHEIRTPLNGVIGMTGLLRDTKLSEEQREYIESIRVSGELLLSVINDILDFSKIGSNQMKIEKVDFNIYNLVDESIEMIAPQIHRKGVAVGACIEGDVPDWLVGDASRIRQVLGNLLNNAAKFTEKGEISLKIKFVSKEESKVTLKFEIIDTGIGIPTEKLENIFDPFTQGDISTSRKYGGTGLGLAISKRLIELMGGTIGVDSIPERGSRFWFTMVFEETHAHIEKMVFEVSPDLIGKSIICVDDNTINRDIVKQQLENWKLRCDVAMDAAEALSMMRKASTHNEPYALALIDFLMPGMDGLELVQVMRQLPGLKEVPAILLMSLGTIFNAEEFEQLNIKRVLTKPIRHAKLFEAITSVLSTNKANITLRHEKIEENIINLKSNKNFRVLLVEDNVINQQVAMRILKKLGFNPQVASNGKEAVIAVNNRDYDIIFMDCQMPEMDGYTATREIRKMEAENNKKHTPIIAMTAYALKGDKEKCVAAGMDDYVSKPFHVKTLTDILEAYLFQDKTALNAQASLETKMERPSDTLEEQNNDPVLDIARLNEIFGDDQTVIQDFLKQFVVSAKTILATIRTSLQSNDLANIKNNLHQLKGSAGNSGIVQIHMLSKQAEEKAKNGEMASLNTLITLIENALEKLEVEIANRAEEG